MKYNLIYVSLFVSTTLFSCLPVMSEKEKQQNYDKSMIQLEKLYLKEIDRRDKGLEYDKEFVSDWELDIEKPSN